MSEWLNDLNDPDWYVMVGKDPDRPLDGPFTLPHAFEFARQNYQDDTQLVRLRPNGERDVVASTDPRDVM